MSNLPRRALEVCGRALHYDIEIKRLPCFRPLRRRNKPAVIEGWRYDQPMGFQMRFIAADIRLGSHALMTALFSYLFGSESMMEPHVDEPNTV